MGGAVCRAERMDGGGVGRHCQTEMKVALKKRKEGRKAETKTSDKENESVQRKWPGGVAPPEESPTGWCFLSSQRLGVGGTAGQRCCHCDTLGQRLPGSFGKEGLLPPAQRRGSDTKPRAPGRGWTDYVLLAASGTLIRPHQACLFSIKRVQPPKPTTRPGGLTEPQPGARRMACGWGGGRPC